MLLGLARCGVEAPPEPPRIETPARVKDLRAAQIGRAIYLDFTLPVLATDGERLTKPLELQIFRGLAPPGASALPPGPAPWLVILPPDLHAYRHQNKFEYAWRLSAPEYRQWQHSTFTFFVVALTRAFRGHPHPSAPSNPVQVQLLDASEPVANLGVRTTQNALELHWLPPARTLTGAPASNLSGYRVYLSTTGQAGSFQPLAETKEAHFADAHFQFGKTYFFQVRAITAAGNFQAESEISNTAVVTPKDTFPPAVPRRVTALFTAGEVDVLWSADTDRDLAGYNVYRRTESGQFARVNQQLLATPIFADTSVARGRTYEYAVTAVDLAGNESAPSPPVQVSTSLPGGP